MRNKNLLIFGALGLGAVLLLSKKDTAAAPPVTSIAPGEPYPDPVPVVEVTPTFKKTNQSTLPEMVADLESWARRQDPAWNGQEPYILGIVKSKGELGIKNMHALLWDIWQPGIAIENYPFKVYWDLSPASWENSVGQWWVNLKQEYKF